MLNWLKTHKKWLIPTGVAAVFVSLLFSITLHLQHKRQEERNGSTTENTPGKETVLPQKKPTTQDKPGQSTTAQDKPVQVATGENKQVSDLPAGMIPKNRISAFKREPSPAEVTRKFETMDVYERKTEEKKLTDLQVIWPLYFFSITKHGQDAVSVMLDTSEDGFGVIIKTEINLKKYPDIATAQHGDKIWLAGKIAEIDTHGTGQITLVTEFAGFADGNRKQ